MEQGRCIQCEKRARRVEIAREVIVLAAMLATIASAVVVVGAQL